ncbi:hypothetical protein Hanom_Chr04g00293181 [Helianthus anomalus]
MFMCQIMKPKVIWGMILLHLLTPNSFLAMKQSDSQHITNPVRAPEACPQTRDPTRLVSLIQSAPSKT